MKRWWLVLLLMLSVGINLGLLASRWLPERKTSAGPTPTSSLEEDSTDLNPATANPESSDSPLPRIYLRMARDLQLEGKSRDQFLHLQRRFLLRSISARNQLQRSQAQLKHELLATEPRHEVVREQLDRMAEARGELETAFAENILDTRELLRPAQARRFLKMIQRLRQSRQQFQQRQQRPPFQQ